MPWSLYGRSKSRPASGETGTQEAELSPVRRGQSLDISRTLALANLHDDDTTQSGSPNDQQKRNRRSSFAAWRSSGSSSSPFRSNAVDGEVELQPGHATPYTAFGVRGGFAVYTPSSSPASGPRYQYAESQRSEEDDSNEGASLYTPASSITRVIVSPTLTPVDSGFAEFGPDSVIDSEVTRDSPGKKKGEPSGVLSDDNKTAAGASEQTSLLGHKKTRSRGWFSFNNNSAVTDTLAPSPPSPSEALSESTTTVRETATHPSCTSTAAKPVGASKPTKVTSATISTPIATSSKIKMSGSGFLSRGQGRKRGDSEVSLKDISQGPL